MNVNIVDQLLPLHYQNIADIDQLQKAQADSLYKQIITTPEGFSFLIEHFSEFQSSIAINLATGLIYNKLKYMGDGAEEDSLVRFRQILFEQALQLYNRIDNDARLTLARAQSQLIIRLYPNPWNDFFQFLFSQPQLFVLYFLAEFTSVLVIPSPSTIQTIAGIKSTLFSTGTEQAILQYITSGMQAQIAPAFSALASFSRWTHIQWVSDASVLQIFQSGFSNEALAPSAADVFANLTMRGMPPDAKIALINNLQMIQTLYGICQNFSNNEQVLLAAAKVTTQAGALLIDSDFVEPFYNLSLQFILTPFDKVAMAVQSFLIIFVMKRPDFAPAIITQIIQRLALFFSINPQAGATVFVESLTRTVARAYHSNPPASYQVLTQAAQTEGIMQNPPFASSVLSCLGAITFRSPAQQKDENDLPNFNVFLSTFQEILGIQPPLTEAAFSPVYFYLRLLTQTPIFDFPEEFFNPFFAAIFGFAVNTDQPPELRQPFGNLLFKCVADPHRKQKILIEPDQIYQLLTIGTPDLVNCAGKLVSTMAQQNQPPTIIKCIEVLNGAITAAADKRPVVVSSLRFIENIECPNEPMSQSAIATFLGNIIGSCGGDDEIIGLVIKCCVSLRLNGFTLFLQCFQFPLGKMSLASITDVALRMKTMADKEPNHPIAEQVHNPEWIVQLIQLVMGPFMECMVNLYTEIADKQEYVQVYQPLIVSTFRFFGEFVVFLNDEQFFQILTPLIEILIRKYDSPFLLEWTLVFLQYAAKAERNVSFLASELTSSSMNFIFAPTFDPNAIAWERIIIRAYNFQDVLRQKAYASFTVKLSEALQSFGCSSDFIERYIRTFEGDARKWQNEFKYLFNDLIVSRNSITW